MSNKLLQLIIDPSSNQLSASRLGLLIVNIVGCCISIFLAWHSPTQAAVVITSLATTDAGVYFASTRKHFKENCSGEEDGN